LILVALAALVACAPDPPPAPAETAKAAETATVQVVEMSHAPTPLPSGPVLASASASAAAPLPRCPPDMIDGGKFCVDPYEAILEREDGAGGWVVHPHFERPAPGVRYRAVSRAGEYPQSYVSEVESAAACAASGKRLCTKSEWESACRGKGYKPFPYGVMGVEGKCNSAKAHLLRAFFHREVGFSYDDFNDPRLAQQPGFLARTGEYAECHNARGTFDMVGNLHEWVSTKVDKALLGSILVDGTHRQHQPMIEGNGIFMGGFFSTREELGPGCYFTTIAHEQTYHDYSIGFRCCADPR
jgi:sulfatase modifying factor 1